jgi:drug/metabolite transporter (DMT)-like permease
LLIAALLIQQTLGALTFPTAKFGLAVIEPMTFAFFRYIVASIVLLAIVRCVRSAPPIAPADRWRIVGLGVLIIIFNQTAYLLGQSMTSAGHGALLFATTPIWICILARVHLKERMTWQRILGIALALGGVGVVMSQGAVGFGSSHLLGDAIILLAVLAWAYYTILGKPLVRRYGALRVTTYALASGSACYAPFGAYRAIVFDYSTTTTAAWGSVLYVAIGTSVVAYLIWYWVLKYMDASRVAVYHNTQPIIASYVAYSFLGEPLGALFIVGGLIVLAGLITTELEPISRSAPSAGDRPRRAGGVAAQVQARADFARQPDIEDRG